MVVNWPAIGAVVLPNVGGWANSVYMKNEIKTWYPTLTKPSWTPPDYVFGPVWTSLYAGMGYASYLVWRDCGRQLGGRAAVPLGLYASQLAVNWAWTPIFFKAHSLKWSLVNIVVLTGGATACAYSFYQVNQTAGLLMLPYLAWPPPSTTASTRTTPGRSRTSNNPLTALHKVNQVAGLLMLPYLAWLALATSLNYRIYKDNPKQIKDQ